MKKLFAICLTAFVVGCIPPSWFPPVPTPTPVASPTVAPTPTPEPTATPIPPTPPTTPTATPSTTPACTLPPQTQPSVCEHDPHSAPTLIQYVHDAQNAAEAAGLSNNGHVHNDVVYIKFIAAHIRARGVCSTNGVEHGHFANDEVWLKDPKKEGNELSEHFDIVTSDMRVWDKFASKCRKARF